MKYSLSSLLYLYVDKEVRYFIQTQDGDSGAPLLGYDAKKQCYVLIGVHVRRSEDPPFYKVAARLTTDLMEKVIERI